MPSCQKREKREKVVNDMEKEETTNACAVGYGDNLARARDASKTPWRIAT
jgi:hypothetical protein